MALFCFRLAILICCGISYACNGYFGYTQASILELAIVIAIAAIALDVVKSLSLSLSLRCWQNKRGIASCACLFLYGIAALVSLTAAFGFYTTLKDHKSGHAKALKTAYHNALAEQQDLKTALNTLGTPRSIDELKADIARLKSKEVFWNAKRSNRCTNATIPQSELFCDQLGDLKVELAIAQNLWPQIIELRVKLKKVEDKIHRTDLKQIYVKSDPQIETLALWFQVSKEVVQATLSVLIALALELASGFGFYVLSASRPTPPQSVVRKVAPVKQNHRPMCFFQEHILEKPGAYAAFHDLFPAYKAWCKHNKSTAAMTSIAFARELNKRGFQKKRSSFHQDRTRPTVYHGLCLKHTKYPKHISQVKSQTPS